MPTVTVNPSGGTYASLNLAEADMFGNTSLDFVTDLYDVTVECGPFVDTSAVTFQSYITNATYNITITAAAGAEATIPMTTDGSRYLLEDTNQTGNIELNGTNYVTLSKLQILCTSLVAGNNPISYSGADNVIVERCYIRDLRTNNVSILIQMQGGVSSATVINSVIESYSINGIASMIRYWTSAGIVRNNTFIIHGNADLLDALSGTDSTTSFENNLIYFSETWTGSLSAGGKAFTSTDVRNNAYINLSTTLKSGEVGSIVDLTKNEFVDFDNGDYRLDPENTSLLGQGVDLSVNFTDDFEGYTRPQWDIGASSVPTLVESVVDTGGTGNYLSLQAAESDNFGATSADLVANHEYTKTNCISTDGNADTANVNISGMTVDGSHIIIVEGDNNTGKWNTSYYHKMFTAAWNYYYNFRISGTAFCRVRNIFFEVTLSSNYVDTHAMLCSSPGGRVENCFAKAIVGSATGTNHAGLQAAGLRWAKNNIMVGWKNVGETSGRGFYIVEGSIGGITYRPRMLNNTAIGCYNGYQVAYQHGSFKNCIEKGSNIGFFGAVDPNVTSEYNASEDGTHPGTNGSTGIVTFVNEGNGDYRPLNGDSVAASAKDLSSFTDGIPGFNTDLSNSFRPSTEFTKGALVTVPTLVETVVDTGGTGNYLSLNAAESDNFGATSSDLLANHERVTCSTKASTGVADTNSVAINGQSTDRIHIIKVKQDDTQRHLGLWDTNKYRLELTNAGLEIWDDYTIVDGIQLSVIGSNTAFGFFVATPSRFTLLNSITNISNTGNGTDGLKILSGATLGKLFLVNNIFYRDNIVTGDRGLELLGGGILNYVYNNTIIGFSTGIETSWQTTIVKNTIVQDADLECFSTANSFHPDSATNISEDATSASGTDTINTTLTFKDAINNDFHLVPADTAAIDTGTDLSNDSVFPFNTDAEGVAITTWNIGALETVFISGGSQFPIELLGNYNKNTIYPILRY